MCNETKCAMVWADAKLQTKPIHVAAPYHFVFLGEILSYIEKNEKIQIDVFDFEARNTEFSTFIKSLIKYKYKSIAFFVNTDNIENTLTLLEFVKQISPETKCIAYGELCVFLPDFFVKTNFDAIVSEKCDCEVAIQDFFSFSYGSKNKEELRGVKFIEDNKLKLYKNGVFLPAQEWEFTDLSKSFVKNLFNIEGKEQVVIEIARGCPYNCKYCKETSFAGNIERRRPIDDVIQYINNSNYKLFKFYASNFTLDEQYVNEFCDKLIKNCKKIKWSCTTRPELLKNENLIKKMALSGCYKISVGVETLGKDELDNLKRGYNIQNIIDGINLLKKYNIEYKALIMLGVPNQTKESILATLNFLSNYNVTIRPTAYTPFYEMSADMSAEEISKFDKRTYYNKIEELSYSNFLNLIYNVDNYKKIL